MVHRAIAAEGDGSLRPCCDFAAPRSRIFRDETDGAPELALMRRMVRGAPARGARSRTPNSRRPPFSMAATPPMSNSFRPISSAIRTPSIPNGGLFSRSSAMIARRSRRSANGPQWRKPNWPLAANGELISALDGDWAKRRRRKPAKPGAPKPSLPQSRAAARGAADRRAAGDARFGARADDDPRLPHARPSARETRSARHRTAEGQRRAAPGDLWLHRG